MTKKYPSHKNMIRRPEQINELLRGELANLISREIKMPGGGLITVTRADCSPDLRFARINITVWPPALEDAALKALGRQGHAFSRALREKLRWKFIPRFDWRIDAGEKEAAAIDELLEQIGKENDKQPD